MTLKSSDSKHATMSWTDLDRSLLFPHNQYLTRTEVTCVLSFKIPSSHNTRRSAAKFVDVTWCGVKEQEKKQEKEKSGRYLLASDSMEIMLSGRAVISRGFKKRNKFKRKKTTHSPRAQEVESRRED